MGNQRCGGVLVVFLFLAACSNASVQGVASTDTSSPVGTIALSTVTTSLVPKRVVGLIPVDPDLDVIHAPASVAVNDLLTVTVISYGSSSCLSSAGAEIDVSGLTATITPFDFDRASEGIGCTADFAGRPRDVQLMFHEQGAGTIRVIGRNFDGGRTMREIRIAITP